MLTPPLSNVRLAGGRVLGPDGLVIGDLSLSDGLITRSANPRGAMIDLGGYLVLPGIIDLHGDAFEHHIAPRPSAPFPLEMGLEGTDKDAAANGITTAWLAQSWSWEGGHRSPEFAEKLLAAHRDYRARQLTDLHVQLRCETHTVDSQERLIDTVRAYDVDYVIFNNHLDEALDMAERAPERVAFWAAKAGRTPEEHMSLVHQAKEQTEAVPRYLCNLATAFDNLGVKYGSHDDPDARTRENFSIFCAKICEFPTTFAAASAAKTWGDPILMGAPNVVRGGSQSGNISAMDLIKERLCAALVSDYHYPTLHKAAFFLVDQKGVDLPYAWRMISTTPAQIMELEDRGTLSAGYRADVVIIHEETRLIEGTIAGGRWSFLAAGLAQRVGQAVARVAVAAE